MQIRPKAGTARIRIHQTMKRGWVWEFVTDDGHVAHQSEPFAEREACETDAMKQGLPVVGLRRLLKRRSKPQDNTETLSANVTVVREHASQLWHWLRLDDVGD